MWVGNDHRERFRIGFRTGLLMWRPRTAHGLRSDLEMVDQVWPRPNRWTQPGLGRIRNQFVQPRIALALTSGFDTHPLPLMDQIVDQFPQKLTTFEITLQHLEPT